MKHGFSLVELSIVLVILGLLTGGILAGKSLIRASELRSVTTEAMRYHTASQAFRDKYFSIPGDFSEATRFWMRQNASVSCFSASGGSVTSTGVCDGDGNGLLEASAANQSGEIFQFWRHLDHAGLIEGSYSGLAGAGGWVEATVGTNVPASKISNAGWSTRTVTQSANGTFTDGYYRNIFSFGAPYPLQYTFGKAITPAEAWNIDTKMDDGQPQKGKIWAIWWDNCTTAADSTVTNAAYDLTTNSVQCALAFFNGVN